MDDDEYEQVIIDNIEKHGWFCTAVFDPEGLELPFCYSVGFTQTLNYPEFIVFGLDTKLMHSMLWSVFRQIRDGKQPEDNQPWADLLEGYDCISRTVHPSNVVREYLNSAIWFWGDPAERGLLQAYQLVWPAVGAGGYPWDPSCPQDVRDLQPPLYLPNRQLS